MTVWVDTSNGTPGSSGVLVGGNVGATVAAAASITITEFVTEISGSATINTINGLISGRVYTLVPAIGASWSFGTTGNIAASFSAVPGVPVLVVMHGALVRTLAGGAAKLPFIYLADAPYNVAPDGVADFTAEIQGAIRDAVRLISGSNYAIRVIAPPGLIVSGTLLFSNNGANRATLIFEGQGYSSRFKLKSGVNGPLFDIGLATSNGLVLAHFRDFAAIGNAAGQTVAAPLFRIRNADRCWFDRIYQEDSKGDGWYVGNSSVDFFRCEAFANAGYGVNVEDSTSVFWRSGYINNNALKGLRAKYTGAAGILTSQDQFGLSLLDSHFEQNVGGEIVVDSADNVVIDGNEFDPIAAAYANGVVQIIGTSRKCFFGRENRVSGGEPLAISSGGSNSGAIFLFLGAQTSGNVYAMPRGSAGTSFGDVGTCNMQVSDFGHNFSIDERQSMFDFAGQAGGHHAAGWQGIVEQNLLLQSEDLSNAAWTKSNSVVTQVVTYGNPSDSTYNVATISSQIAPTVGQDGYVQQQVNVPAGVVTGNKFTFSVWLLAPGDVDVRLEIRDQTDALFAREFAFIGATGFTANNKYVNGWLLGRRSVSITIAGSVPTQFRCRIVKYGGGSSTSVYAWGAQLNEGRLSAYIPTVGAAKSGYVGLVAMGVLATKKMGALALPVFANNAAAVAGGLVVGDFYRTSADPDPVCVVH